jgi:hypothetical protein
VTWWSTINKEAAKNVQKVVVLETDALNKDKGGNLTIEYQKVFISPIFVDIFHISFAGFHFRVISFKVQLFFLTQGLVLVRQALYT